MQHPGSGDQPVDHTDSVEAKGFDGGLVAGYRLVEVRGEGPTGVVYRCVAAGGTAARRGSRPLVMKVLHRELCHAPSMVALRSDLDRLTLAADAHVAQLLDSGFTEDGRFFLVTEELAGLDLGAALDGAGAVPRERALDVMRQVCTAVRSAHAAGVVHGGLKPRNVFLMAQGEVRVTDFAASRRADAAGGVLFGDPRYMSPEQLGGFSDPRSDVYALGVLLHQLLTGQLPSAGAGGAEVALGHLHGGARASASPSHIASVAYLDRGLRGIWERALDPRPSARYANAGQVLHALEAWSRNHELSQAAALLAGARGPGHREATLDAGAATDHSSRLSRMPLAELDSVVLSAAAPPTSGHNASNGHTDSIESSLEDFISQAAKSFGEPSDGWSLNTDEVELVEPEEPRVPVAARAALTPPAPPAPPSAPIGARVPPAAPAVSPSPAAAPPAAAALAVPLAPSAPEVSALAATIAPASTAVGAPVAAAAAAFSMDPSVPVTEGATGSTVVTAIPVFEEPGAALPSADAVLAAPAVAAPAVADPAVARPAPVMAVAPVVLAAAPVQPARAPRSASPIPVAVGAGVGGAVLVLVVMRIMGPPVAAPIAPPVPAAPIVEPAVTVTPTPRLTPIVTPTVTPIVAAPTTTPAAPAPSNTPVVTPLPVAAAPAAAVGVPVVTPIPAAPAAPAMVPSVAPAPVAAPAARPRHRAPPAKVARPVARPAPKPVAAPKPAPAAKPAAKPAAPTPTPKKGDKKGDGWVDPFAG